MSRLVVHIGMSKTGTTAFQDFISANRQLLAEQGLAYPDMLRGPNHAQLAVAFARRASAVSRSLGVEGERDRARLRRRLRRRLKARVDDAPAWIASSEQLSTMVRWRADIRALAEFLHDVFDRVDVVVTLRRPDYWLPSSYVEYVSSGGLKPLDDNFVRHRGYYLDHIAFLRRWRRIFGMGRVHAVPYLEADKRRPAALPARILLAAGVPQETVLQWPSPPALHNTSLSAEATEILRRVNPQLRTSRLRPVTSRNLVNDFVGERWPGRPPALTQAAAGALRLLPPTWPGIHRAGFAEGPGWWRWRQQPDAPITAAVDVAPETVAAVTQELTDAGLQGASWDSDVAEHVRRWAIRIVRR